MCAIFGVFNQSKSAELTVIGLHGNQHRAIDSAGMVSSDGVNFYRERGYGLARQVFTKEILTRLHGKDALGHIRYPTVIDDERRDNIQPIVGRYGDMPIAIAHNGNLTNCDELRKTILKLQMSTSMDTEYILRLIEHLSSGNLYSDLTTVFKMLRGSFALGILLPDRLIAVRDKSGNRPLSIGKIDGGYCISSETCAFPNVGATYFDEVQPGTMTIITKEGLKSIPFDLIDEKKCRFEGIYYSHPGSKVFGDQVANFRINLGRALEKSCPVIGGADIVTPVPDSSNFIAMGFGESGCSGKYFPVIVRSHYAGRTFIAATQALRDIEVSQKFTFMADEIAGKKIVVVDDSIVRGTTMPKIVNMLRRLGAKEVHIRIGSPPITHSCRYGINTPTTEELIATRFTVSEMCKEFGADSLEFTPLEVLKGLSSDHQTFCFACMTGEYW